MRKDYFFVWGNYANDSEQTKQSKTNKALIQKIKNCFGL